MHTFKIGGIGCTLTTSHNNADMLLGVLAVCGAGEIKRHDDEHVSYSVYGGGSTPEVLIGVVYVTEHVDDEEKFWADMENHVVTTYLEGETA